MSAPCGTPVIGNRRTFWTLQPCKVVKDNCGNDCAKWGLELECGTADVCGDDHLPGETRTFKRNDWVRSLIMSILGTDGRRPANECGYRPGTRGGHWSDSYRNNEYPGTSGTRIRDLQAHGRISDAIQELRAKLQYDMQRLVTYGVASAVEVEVTYKGAQTAAVNIIVYGQGLDAETRVGLSTTRIANAWVWDT